jgi:hypothetical protein
MITERVTLRRWPNPPQDYSPAAVAARWEAMKPLYDATRNKGAPAVQPNSASGARAAVPAPTPAALPSVSPVVSPVRAVPRERGWPYLGVRRKGILAMVVHDASKP